MITKKITRLLILSFAILTMMSSVSIFHSKNQVYALDSSGITNLEGTTWTFNQLIEFYGDTGSTTDYFVNYTLVCPETDGDTVLSEMGLEISFSVSNFGINDDEDDLVHQVSIHMFGDRVYSNAYRWNEGGSGVWTYNGLRTITFVDGDDIANPNLISFMRSNAELISIDGGSGGGSGEGDDAGVVADIVIPTAIIVFVGIIIMAIIVDGKRKKIKVK